MYSTDSTQRLPISSPPQQSPHIFSPFVNGQYMYPQSSQMLPQDPYFYMNNHQYPQPTVSIFFITNHPVS